MDNQLTCHCGIEAWCELTKADWLKTDSDLNIFIMFDHEEVRISLASLI
jgi:aspartyl aminopeptidase